MDRQEYLNQISAPSTQAKSSGGSLLSSKYLIWGLVGMAVLTVIIIVVGMIMSAGKKDPLKDTLNKLDMRIDYVSAAIGTYQGYVKSSNLRSTSSSFNTILSNTKRDLSEYIAATYKPSKDDKQTPQVSKIVTNEIEVAKQSLNDALLDARVNGILDRVYAHKMIYELSMIMTDEETIMKLAKNEELQALITTSYQSLEPIYKNFDEFSEAN